MWGDFDEVQLCESGKISCLKEEDSVVRKCGDYYAEVVTAF